MYRTGAGAFVNRLSELGLVHRDGCSLVLTWKMTLWWLQTFCFFLSDEFHSVLGPMSLLWWPVSPDQLTTGFGVYEVAQLRRVFDFRPGFIKLSLSQPFYGLRVSVKFGA